MKRWDKNRTGNEMKRKGDIIESVVLERRVRRQSESPGLCFTLTLCCQPLPVELRRLKCVCVCVSVGGEGVRNARPKIIRVKIIRCKCSCWSMHSSYGQSVATGMPRAARNPPPGQFYRTLNWPQGVGCRLSGRWRTLGKKKKGLKANKQQIRPLSDILENRRIGFLAQRKRESWSHSDIC